MDTYRSPPWLGGSGPVGGHLQTIWPALFSSSFRGPQPRYRRDRWNTPDGDFIDLDWLERDASSSEQRPLLVLFHGLEGSSSSPYALAFANWARSNGWAYVVPHFRGCSGEINLAPRAYHSGDFEEIDWILKRLRSQHNGPMVAVGISLGGNALLRWAEESGQTASGQVSAIAAVSSPIDLMAGGTAICAGFNRQVYNRMFMRTMVRKALQKLGQHPKLFSVEGLRASRDLRAFDNVFTAPLHGFRDVDDYWTRGSAKPHLERIRVPALVLNARNDPFMPASALPGPGEVGSHVALWQPEQGGHVGFPRGQWPGHVLTLPEQVMGWLAAFTGTTQLKGI
jgi:predicted alpha/beta-fold hydrolase